MDSTLINELESNGVLWLNESQIGDLLDIDARAKFGDESGWRGDPSFHVCINTLTGWFEIWGRDVTGQPYKAASHDKLDLTLITKLRDGDPRKNDVFDRVMKQNAKLEADRKAAARDAFGAVAEKMAWATRRDFRDELGTGAHDVYPVGDIAAKDGA